jgi:hypothetical protein
MRTRALLLILVAGCSSLSEHARSKITENELIRLEVTRHEEEAAPVVRLAAVAEQGPPKDPLVVDLLRDQLAVELSTVMRSPPVDWSGTVRAPCYAAPARPIGDRGAVALRPAVQGFTIERHARGAFATRLGFSLREADGLLEIVWDDVKMDYSRAPVTDASWNTWWTRIPMLYGFGFDVARLFGTRYGDDAVDLRVDVTIKAAWTDGAGHVRRAVVGAAHWTQLDVPLGGPTLEIGRVGGWLALPPPSTVVAADGSVGLGQTHLLIEVTVTEHDDLGASYNSVRRISEGLADQTFLGQG